jgi:hypothetical protein
MNSRLSKAIRCETCQDNGLLMLKFERGVWPFEDSTTPPGQQN